MTQKNNDGQDKTNALEAKIREEIQSRCAYMDFLGHIGDIDHNTFAIRLGAQLFREIGMLVEPMNEHDEYLWKIVNTANVYLQFFRLITRGHLRELIMREDKQGEEPTDDDFKVFEELMHKQLSDIFKNRKEITKDNPWDFGR